MNFDFAMSAKISKQTVEDMVRTAVETQTKRKVKKVTFSTREVSDYQDRYSHYEFDGCTVEFDTTDLNYDYGGQR